jgi:hypothetical protein
MSVGPTEVKFFLTLFEIPFILPNNSLINISRGRYSLGHLTALYQAICAIRHLKFCLGLQHETTTQVTRSSFF